MPLRPGGAPSLYVWEKWPIGNEELKTSYAINLSIYNELATRCTGTHRLGGEEVQVFLHAHRQGLYRIRWCPHGCQAIDVNLIQLFGVCTVRICMCSRAGAVELLGLTKRRRSPDPVLALG